MIKMGQDAFQSKDKDVKKYQVFFYGTLSSLICLDHPVSSHISTVPWVVQRISSQIDFRSLRMRQYTPLRILWIFSKTSLCRFLEAGISILGVILEKLMQPFVP